jgi:hypothetical protein
MESHVRSLPCGGANVLPNNEMQRTKHGSAGASPLISVLGRSDNTNDEVHRFHRISGMVGVAGFSVGAVG